MIPSYQLVKRLQEEKSQMRKNGYHLPFVMGFVEALELAIAIVQEMEQEQQARIKV